jgi:hypothetical protein
VMKKILLLIVVILIGTRTIAQIESISTIQNFDLIEAVVVTTFILNSEDEDSVIELLHSALGEPTRKELYGILFWEQLEISGVGKNLTIKCLNGFKTPVNKAFRVDAFESDEHKNSSIASFKDGQERILTISIFKKNNKNFKWTEPKVKKMKEYLINLNN